LEHRASVKRFVSLQFLSLKQSLGLLGRGISPSSGRYLTQTHNKHTQTSMPWVRFERTTQVFERAKTYHALYCAATVIGLGMYYDHMISQHGSPGTFNLLFFLQKYLRISYVIKLHSDKWGTINSCVHFNEL
jgi:hypothetical protein